MKIVSALVWTVVVAMVVGAVMALASHDKTQPQPVHRFPEFVRPQGPLSCKQFKSATVALKGLKADMTMEQVVALLGQPSVARVSSPKGPESAVEKNMRLDFDFTPLSTCASVTGQRFPEGAGGIKVLFGIESKLVQNWVWEYEPFKYHNYPEPRS